LQYLTVPLHVSDDFMNTALAPAFEEQPGAGRSSRNNGSPTRQQSHMARRLARGAITFLDLLDAHDLTLNSCQQADLDRWLAGERAVYREEAGRFIRWARGSKLTAGYVAAAPRWNGPAQLLDHKDRWDIARRLLHDGNLKPEDRLAGLLVLLYAQGTTAISRMTVSQIRVSEHGVRLRLGRAPSSYPSRSPASPARSWQTAKATPRSERRNHRTGSSPDASPDGPLAPPG